MSAVVLLLVLALPFAEIATFIMVGKAIGLWPTLGLTILAMGVGLMIVKAQGLGHLRDMRSNLKAGQMPIADMLHSLLLVIAGFLFLLPGFLTDILAILLLLPPVRALIGLWMVRNMTIVTRGAARSGPATGDSTIIEGEFTETARSDALLPQNSGKEPGRD